MAHPVWRRNMWNVVFCSDLYGKWEFGSGLPFLCKTRIPDCWLSDKIQWYHGGASSQRKYKVSACISHPFLKKMSSQRWIKYLGPGNNETFILKVSKRMKNSAYKCPIFPPVLQNHFPPSHTSAGGRLILHIICSWAPSSTIVGNVEFVHS